MTDIIADARRGGGRGSGAVRYRRHGCRWPAGRLADLSAGQPDAERRPAARPVLDPRGSAVELGELRDERQTDPGACPNVVALPERLEDPRLRVVGYARSFVLDGEHGPVRAGLDANVDRRAGRRVLHGVDEQVLDNPVDLSRIDVDPYGVRGLEVDGVP